MAKISVSILTKNDKDTISKLNETNVDYFHIDAMDGIFVNDVNFTLPEIKKISEYTNKELDVHLMVERPDDYIETLSNMNISYITVHYEVLNGDVNIIKKIKNNGIKCGVSVKPNTDINDIFYLLDEIDLILIMSVEPGYGGQEFMPSSLDKVKVLKAELERRNSNVIIAIDGGICARNAKSCIDAGCDMLISGSYIVNSDNYQVAIDSLRE